MENVYVGITITGIKILENATSNAEMDSELTLETLMDHVKKTAQLITKSEEENVEDAQ